MSKLAEHTISPTTSPYTPSDGSLGFHHHKPNLTVKIDTKELEAAHKIDVEGNVVNNVDVLSDKQLEKIGKKQLKSKLLSDDSMNEIFHMDTDNVDVSNGIHREKDISLDRLGSIDSLKSAGSVVKVDDNSRNGKNGKRTEDPKKCKYHQEMDSSWVCEKCKCDVCELCSMSKMEGSDLMICHHCFDERAKDINMIWLVVGAFCLGIVFPPLWVAAPIVVIMRSHNDRFKRIGWILFWLVILGVFLLFSSGFITTISLKYAGKL